MADARPPRRWRVWLGWGAGVALGLWALSGLMLLAGPDDADGADRLRPPRPVRLVGPAVPPAVAGVALTRLSLEPRADGPRWVIVLPGGKARLGDPATGRLLAPLAARDALREFAARYTGDAEVRSVSRIGGADAPAWQVALDDGSRFAVDAGSGEIVAIPTGWRRVQEWARRLHRLGG